MYKGDKMTNQMVKRNIFALIMANIVVGLSIFAAWYLIEEMPVRIELSKAAYQLWLALPLVSFLVAWMMQRIRVRRQLEQLRQDVKYRLMNGDNAVVIDDLEKLMSRHGWVKPHA